MEMAYTLLSIPFPAHISAPMDASRPSHSAVDRLADNLTLSAVRFVINLRRADHCYWDQVDQSGEPQGSTLPVTINAPFPARTLPLLLIHYDKFTKI